MAGIARSYYRRRVTIPGVGVTPVDATIELLDPPGEIRNVFATLDASRAPGASTGTTGATDVAVAIRDAAPLTSRVLWETEIDVEAPCITVEADLERGFVRRTLYARVSCYPGATQDAVMVLDVEFAE